MALEYPVNSFGSFGKGTRLLDYLQPVLGQVPAIHKSSGSGRPVGLALYGRSNRKSVGSPKTV
eukprot:4864824-Pleurochrysis_carterae.AAC.3